MSNQDDDHAPEARVAYTVRLPQNVVDMAKDAANHYRMSVTDFFQLAITTTFGQLEDRDGKIPHRVKTQHISIKNLSQSLRERAANTSEE